MDGAPLSARLTRKIMSLIALVVLALSSSAVMASQLQSSANVFVPLVTGANSTTTSTWVMAYYVGYQRDMLPADQIDWSTLTHIVVGRLKPAANGSIMTDFDIDDVQGPQMARDLAQRAHAAGRKAILMLGGAGEHDAFVSAAATATRATFVHNLLNVIDELGYDGVDVDWEPINASDRPLLLALLQDLRTARPAMLMTIPVNWVNENFPEDIDSYYAQIAALVDRINIMSYDMGNNWPGWASWHFGPIYDSSATYPASIDGSVQIYLKAHVPAKKLGIGVGFYGSCWRGVTAPRVPLDGQNVSMGNSDNFMTYAAILHDYLPSAVRTFDTVAKVPYLSSNVGVGPQHCNFISYEDPESIADKGAYVRSNGLGGAIIWTIAEGYVATAPAGSRDPLMQAMKHAFIDP